ncbi:MAG: polysaccharide pyruvyl transferase family protein [Candidatus Njordarchaeia archaeon]
MHRGTSIVLYNWGHLGGSDSNLGDKIMFTALLGHLLKRISGILVVFTTDSQYTRRSIINLIKKISTGKEEIKTVIRIRKFPVLNLADYIQLIKEIRRAKIIVIGGGEIIYDKSSYMYSFFNLYPAMFNSTIFLGVGATESEFWFLTKLIIHLIKKNIKLIITRDSKSKMTFKRFYNNKIPIIAGTDIAFSYLSLFNDEKSFPKNIDINRKGKIVCIFPRIPFPKAEYSILNFLPFKYRLKFSKKEITEILIKYSKVLLTLLKGIDNIKKIILIPSNNYLGIDTLITNIIERILKKKYEVKNLQSVPEPNEIIHIMKRANLIISSTYHGTILSALLGKPAIALSYSTKVNVFCRMVGYPFIDIRRIRQDEYNEVKNLIFKKPKKEKVRKLIKRSEKMIHIIRNHIIRNILKGDHTQKQISY